LLACWWWLIKECNNEVTTNKVDTIYPHKFLNLSGPSYALANVIILHLHDLGVSLGKKNCLESKTLVTIKFSAQGTGLHTGSQKFFH
jgi:hypothetical protein